MRMVLLGPPGAGKGTQAVHIAAAIQGPHIATGDIFREHVRSSTPLGRTANAHMERGELVPDEIVIGMVTARICDRMRRRASCSTGSRAPWRRPRR